MPKMKTKRAARKRFKLTGTGKVTHKKSNARHILTKKAPNRKRNNRGTRVLDKADTRRIKELLDT
ncbi:50S ribosomal protein L35 [bacterium]|nr:50S ribosomal protein L35 [bacterium]